MKIKNLFLAIFIVFIASSIAWGAPTDPDVRWRDLSEFAARGIAPPPRYQQTGMQKLSFKVHSSKGEPQGTPYKVALHDHWFFIDMADHKSKALMEALFSLFYSQIGASKPGDPTLTLPLSPSP